MKWFWFPIAVVATSVAFLVALAMLAVPPIGTALASSLGVAPPAGNGAWARGWHGRAWAHGSGFALPSQLQGLASIPPDQRFNHFVGAQINVKDKDGHPLTISVTPGKVTAASATRLTIAANDGTTKIYTLDRSTMIHGRTALTTTPTPTASSTLQNGDNVVVVTLNNSPAATAIIDGGGATSGHGFAWSGSRGPWMPTGHAP